MLSFSPSNLGGWKLYHGLTKSLAQCLGITALNPVTIHIGSTGFWQSGHVAKSSTSMKTFLASREKQWKHTMELNSSWFWCWDSGTEWELRLPPILREGSREERPSSSWCWGRCLGFVADFQQRGKRIGVKPAIITECQSCFAELSKFSCACGSAGR